MNNNITKAIEDLKQGKMIIIADDVNRENEGDIVIAAEKVSESSIAFMAKKASGLICLSITKALAEKLNLHTSVNENQTSIRAAFTESIDAKYGITTGVSASDRTKTILDAIKGSPDNLVSPGHMFPLISRDGGVLERRGHTEASVELTKIAGLIPAAVICEILGDDGKMLRGKDLETFAKEHQLQLVHIEEIVEYVEGNHAV